MPSFTSQDAFNYLTNRGLPPHQAAALVGNLQQESGMNPSALNQGEGAYGLMQWRLDRRQGLENFAKAQGTSADNPQTQLDYALHEMTGPEAKAGSAFLAAPDLATANSALRGFIRYGDESGPARLAYGQQVLGGIPMGSGVPSGAAQIPTGLFAGLGAQPTDSTATDASGLFAKLAAAQLEQAQPQQQGLLQPMGFLPMRRRMRG